jgi:hypothetical protein
VKGEYRGERERERGKRTGHVNDYIYECERDRERRQEIINGDC